MLKRLLGRIDGPRDMAAAISGSAVALRYGLRPAPPVAAPRARVTLDIRDFVYGRYFYNFVKALTLEGVAVDLRFRPATIHRMRRQALSDRVLGERLVRLRLGRGDGRVIGDAGAAVRLAPFDFRPAAAPGVYTVPMAQHPLMYARGHWNRPVAAPEVRRQAMFFVGNADPESYAHLERAGVFDVIGRPRLLDALVRAGVGRQLGPGEPPEAARPGEVVFITAEGRIPMEAFRPTVAGFEFFLAAPGGFMPLCHNLVEAMSVGTVPFIQRGYARLLDPPLEHGRNAIVFDGEADLALRIGEAFSLPPPARAALRAGVLAYHDAHLTPRAVTARVLDPAVHTIRLLAGTLSVDLLRRHGGGNAGPAAP